jgi:hypothetical protein
LTSTSHQSPSLPPPPNTSTNANSASALSPYAKPEFSSTSDQGVDSAPPPMPAPQSGNGSSAGYARVGSSSAAIYKPTGLRTFVKPDGFHSSSSDKTLQAKYGHVPVGAPISGGFSPMPPPPSSGGPTSTPTILTGAGIPTPPTSGGQYTNPYSALHSGGPPVGGAAAAYPRPANRRYVAIDPTTGRSLSTSQQYGVDNTSTLSSAYQYSSATPMAPRFGMFHPSSSLSSTENNVQSMATVPISTPPSDALQASHINPYFPNSTMISTTQSYLSTDDHQQIDYQTGSARHEAHHAPSEYISESKTELTPPPPPHAHPFSSQHVVSFTSSANAMDAATLFGTPSPSRSGSNVSHTSATSTPGASTNNIHGVSETVPAAEIDTPSDVTKSLRNGSLHRTLTDESTKSSASDFFSRPLNTPNVETVLLASSQTADLFEDRPIVDARHDDHKQNSDLSSKANKIVLENGDDDEGMDDVSLSNEPSMDVATHDKDEMLISSSIDKTNSSTVVEPTIASISHEVKSNTLFGAIGMPPPPFQSKRFTSQS